MRKKRESDMNFKLIYNIRTRTNKAFISQNIKKTNKTIDLLGCSPIFFGRWIIHQLYGDMTTYNYGSTRHIDHCLSIASCNSSDETDMKKSFNWVNLRPMYSTENNLRGSKIDHRFYLFQQIKAYQFIKLNEEELN